MAPHLVLCIGLTEGDESVSMSGKTLYRVLFMARDHSAVHEQVCVRVAVERDCGAFEDRG